MNKVVAMYRRSGKTGMLFNSTLFRLVSIGALSLEEALACHDRFLAHLRGENCG